MKIFGISLLLALLLLLCVEAKKTSRSRSSGSGRSTSRKTNSNQPAPTSFSSPQASAPKPSLFGWQEKPGGHSYPSSQTGLSGNNPNKRPPAYQESIQKSVGPQQSAPRPQTNNQGSHSYPSSNGLSGSSSSGGYPPSNGLSGSGSVPAHSSGAGYPQSSVNAGHSHGTGGAGYPHASGGASYPHGSGVAGAGGPSPPYGGYNSGNNYRPNQGPLPAYSNYGGYSGYGGHGGYNSPGYSPQMPGYFGNYGNKYNGVSRGGSALKGIGIAGAGVGTLLTGLALWNLARSTGHHHHTVVYDNRGQPVAVAPANGTDPAIESILNDLVNCTLTINTENATEILAIPCAIATSFTPDADVKDNNSADGKTDNTKCIVTVVTKSGKEYMTTIPCSTLLNTAAENNVTEPALIENGSENTNSSIVPLPDNQKQNTLSALKFSKDPSDLAVNCKSVLEEGDIRDPINPCLAVTHNLTVIPLESTTPTIPAN